MKTLKSYDEYIVNEGFRKNLAMGAAALALAGSPACNLNTNDNYIKTEQQKHDLDSIREILDIISQGIIEPDLSWKKLIYETYPDFFETNIDYKKASAKYIFARSGEYIIEKYPDIRNLDFVKCINYKGLSLFLPIRNLDKQTQVTYDETLNNYLNKCKLEKQEELVKSEKF
jgi:hypothetical protein